jgi:hypothetical protein
MWPLVLGILGIGAYLFEKNAQAQTPAWVPSPVPPGISGKIGTPPMVQGGNVFLILKNTTTGKQIGVNSGIVGIAGDKITLLLGVALDGNGMPMKTPPFGFEPGKFFETTADYVSTGY